jgi:coproporphyrinogen III oxidase-like Fe-S oxidoreductase
VSPQISAVDYRERDIKIKLSRKLPLGERAFGVYIHVPFCASRCGYCDFNTYTATELGGGGTQAAYADWVIAEVRLARRVLGLAELPVSTVFSGAARRACCRPAVWCA